MGQFFEGNILYINALLSLITAIGIIATVWVSLLSYKNTTRYNLPTVSVQIKRVGTSMPRVLFFTLDTGTEYKWMVTRARISGMRGWGKHLSVAGEQVQNDHGEVLGYRPLNAWERTVMFDEPVVEHSVIPGSVLLIHDDIADKFCLLFTVSLRAKPSVYHQVPVSVRCVESQQEKKMRGAIKKEGSGQ